jgi:hypothetical protein
LVRAFAKSQTGGHDITITIAEATAPAKFTRLWPSKIILSKPTNKFSAQVTLAVTPRASFRGAPMEQDFDQMATTIIETNAINTHAK